MSCHEYEPSIERMLADEIGADERDRLLAHTENCPACLEFVDLHHRLIESDMSWELPRDDEFAAMRRTVLAQIGSDPESRTVKIRSALADLFGLFAMRPSLAGGFAALLFVALAGGIFMGRGIAPEEFTFPQLAEGDGLVRQIGRQARANDGLLEVADSPYRYSNVRFREASGGSVSLNFDVTRNVAVERRADDPLVRDVLAQSLLHDGSLDTRLAAVSFAGHSADPVLAQALIHAMLNDRDLGVRKRSLEILAKYAPNDETVEAFVMVLSGEESVDLRLKALDYLAASNAVSRERLDGVMDTLQFDNDLALLASYADEIN